MKDEHKRLSLAEYVAALARLGMAAKDAATKDKALALIEARANEDAAPELVVYKDVGPCGHCDGTGRELAEREFVLQCHRCGGTGRELRLAE